MDIPNIEWKEPWRAIQFAAEIPGVQKQVDSEITTKHPLTGKGAIAIGRRIDNDDVLVILNDGTYASVHLVWGSGPGAFSEQYPSWYLYGSLESFLQAMQEDAAEYCNEA
ncbi:MAG: hypothetical protein MZU95_10435 [Desulfomicrobium escambiense]|nr:hypothetical protein [Desulfomicrobium escambiense]